MERRQRRKFTFEFKQNLLDLIRIKGVKAKQAAENFDINVELIYKWLNDTKDKIQEQKTEDKTQSEIRKLKRRIIEAEGELNIIKKHWASSRNPQSKHL